MTDRHSSYPKLIASKENLEAFRIEWQRKYLHARLADFVRGQTLLLLEKKYRVLKSGLNLRQHMYAMADKKKIN